MFVVTDRQLELWRRARSLVFLVVLTVLLAKQPPRPDPLSGRGIALIAGLAVGAVAWLVMTLRRHRPGPQTGAVAACAAAGLWLTAVVPHNAAPAYLVAATAAGVASLPLLRVAAVIGAGAVGLTAVLAAQRTSVEAIGLWLGGVALTALLGIGRRDRERNAAQEKQLAAEQARVAALAERARLAREVHDVLAHSLSALTLQLETAAALLERDRAAEAATIVDRAGRLARDGLTETRRAVSALRGDPVPLPDLVGELTAGYRQDLGAEATFTISGEPRELAPETGLALFRGAQEALANIRKHAPGSTVAVRLDYSPGTVGLTVDNHGVTAPPVTALPPGYGLAGLRERAELAGGTADAGPHGDGWRVDVRMPG